MMHKERSIEIGASPARIYALAADVVRWPALLPHYRFVHVLREAADSRVVEMAARRGFIPVRWVARQTLRPAEPRIEFEHLAGWTRGMRVAWTFEPRGDATRVTIAHDIDPADSMLPPWLLHRVVGDFFIQNIAGRTLARFKQLAEASHG